MLVSDEICHNYLLSADRAKQIKTKAVVNEDPTDKLIRELKEENERLKNRIKGGDVSEEELKDLAGKDTVSKDELAELKKKWLEEMKVNMKNNEKEVTDHSKSTQEKVGEQQDKEKKEHHQVIRCIELLKSLTLLLSGQRPCQDHGREEVQGASVQLEF